MKWSEIKESIITDINSRGLKDPNIRLRALAKIESIILEHYPSYIENIDGLVQIGKESFKQKISEKKGKDLNSAEKSIINEIFYRLEPPVPKHKYKIIICPHCFTTIKFTEDLWEYDYLTCLECGNIIANPIKEEERMHKIQREFMKLDLLHVMGKGILWIGLFILSIYFMVKCYSS